MIGPFKIRLIDCRIDIGVRFQVSASLPPVSEAEAYVPTVGGAIPPRLGKRPLGRTHSAPLPLGDPALQPLALPLQPPTAHHYLRDQIRKTVRSSRVRHATGRRVARRTPPKRRRVGAGADARARRGGGAAARGGGRGHRPDGAAGRPRGGGRGRGGGRAGHGGAAGARAQLAAGRRARARHRPRLRRAHAQARVRVRSAAPRRRPAAAARPR